MCDWYHRNALKSTTNQSFNLSMIAAQPEAIQICEQLRLNRVKLIELMTDPSSDQSLVEQTLNSYLALLQGMIVSDQMDERHGSTHSSKLRHYIVFKWTNSLLGPKPDAHQDTVFELLSMCYEYAIWLMKHSAYLAVTKEDINMELAKQVHNCLRRAAGVLTELRTNWCDRLLDNKITDGSDLDARVMNAYVFQCQAEAQEVTIARAIELKHSATLISALANETSNLFLSAAASIKALDPLKFGKWLTYFQLKSAVYESYAYCYLGESLLEQEKCGEAIRALQESEKFYELSEKLCKDYSKLKSAYGQNAKLDAHLFFRKLRPLVARIKEKCVRENGFIYHQKVANECPVLELKATHGLVTPESFTVPAIHKLWTPNSYRAFDLTKVVNNSNDKKNSKKPDKSNEAPIEEIKEEPIKSRVTEPKNQSGCQIQ